MYEIKKDIKYLPFFLLLTCVYFYDVFLKGAVLAVGDGFDEFYPLMITMSRQYRNFTFPFWNPYMFSGFPLFGSMQAGALYPFNIVLPLLFSPAAAFNMNLMLHYSLAGFFTFLYARQIGLGIFPSVVAGTIFSLLGYLPSHLIHPSIIASGTWLPLLLFFYDRLRQDPNIKNVIYASFVVALQVFAGHPQICFYTYLLLLFYVLFHLFYQDPSKKLRFVLSGIMPLALGMLIALPQLVATRELAHMTTRAATTYEFFSSYAFSVHMITSFLFPFFYYYGGSSGEYWGPVPDLGVEAFVGTLPFLLAILVMTRWKKSPHILFWGGMAIMAFILSLGDAIRPLNEMLFHLPGYNSFRGLSKHILEMSFALSVLTGFGISFLLDWEKERRFRIELVIVLSSVIAVSLISFIFFGAAMRDFFKDSFSQMQNLQLRWVRGNVPEKALSIADPSIYIPILTMSAYLACLVVFLKVGKKHLRAVCLAVIFLVLFGEALTYKTADLPDSASVKNYNKDLYDKLASDTSGRTVFFTDKVSLLPAMPHGIRLVEGYDPLAIEDYLKMMPQMFSQSPEVCRSLIMNNSLLSMFNVKYLVVDNAVGTAEDVRWHMEEDKKGRSVAVSPLLRAPSPGAESFPIYHKVASFPQFSLYENSLVLPRAHAVAELRPVDSVDELKMMLFSFRMDPRYEAAMSSEDLREIGTEGLSSGGDVKIVEDRPDRITISASFKERGFLVLADQFYPGWEAHIDGKRTKIYKVNGVQRGMVVPEGEHTIVFKYVPRLIYASMLLSGILIIGMLFFLLKKNRHPKN